MDHSSLAAKNNEHLFYILVDRRAFPIAASITSGKIKGRRRSTPWWRRRLGAHEHISTMSHYANFVPNRLQKVPLPFRKLSPEFGRLLRTCLWPQFQLDSLSPDPFCHRDQLLNGQPFQRTRCYQPRDNAIRYRRRLSWSLYHRPIPLLSLAQPSCDHQNRGYQRQCARNLHASFRCRVGNEGRGKIAYLGMRCKGTHPETGSFSSRVSRYSSSRPGFDSSLLHWTYARTKTEWLRYMSNTIDWNYRGSDFEEFRLGGGIEDYTFTDPQEDQCPRPKARTNTLPSARRRSQRANCAGGAFKPAQPNAFSIASSTPQASRRTNQRPGCDESCEALCRSQRFRGQIVLGGVVLRVEEMPAKVDLADVADSSIIRAHFRISESRLFGGIYPGNVTGRGRSESSVG